jgi:hypothetical protein
MRVNRGGSYNDRAVNARSANRNRNTPDNRNNNLGARFASFSKTCQTRAATRRIHRCGRRDRAKDENPVRIQRMTRPATRNRKSLVPLPRIVPKNLATAGARRDSRPERPGGSNSCENLTHSSLRLCVLAPLRFLLPDSRP